MPIRHLVLVDGHNHAWRFHFAMGSKRLDDGTDVGTVHGFHAMLRSFRRDPDTHAVAVCFDTGRPCFRHDLHPDYKKDRTPMPDALRAQMPLVQRLLAAMRVPLLKRHGFEADDVIATLARRHASAGGQVSIYSNDKDLRQLLSERVTIRDWMRKTAFGPAELLAEHGIRPDQMADWLAMTGDASDNIPGIDKVGPKTASMLLAKLGTLDKVLASEHRGKLGDHVDAFKPRVDLTRKLIALADVPDLPAIEDLRLSTEPWDAAALAALGLPSGP